MDGLGDLAEPPQVVSEASAALAMRWNDYRVEVSEKRWCLHDLEGLQDACPAVDILQLDPQSLLSGNRRVGTVRHAKVRGRSATRTSLMRLHVQGPALFVPRKRAPGAAAVAPFIHSTHDTRGSIHRHASRPTRQPDRVDRRSLERPCSEYKDVLAIDCDASFASR